MRHGIGEKYKREGEKTRKKMGFLEMGRRAEIFMALYSTWYVPVYSRVNLTSKMVMTLPFRWLTSTSPSMLTILLILAVTSPSLASIWVRFSSNHVLAQGETSLFTQCQLLGLWRTIFAVRNVEFYAERFFVRGLKGEIALAKKNPVYAFGE